MVLGFVIKIHEIIQRLERLAYSSILNYWYYTVNWCVKFDPIKEDKPILGSVFNKHFTVIVFLSPPPTHIIVNFLKSITVLPHLRFTWLWRCRPLYGLWHRVAASSIFRTKWRQKHFQIRWHCTTSLHHVTTQSILTWNIAALFN